MTVQQHAGTETTVRGPRPFRRRRIASAAPQPGHAECPENISSWAGRVSLAIDRHLLFDVLPMDFGDRSGEERFVHPPDHMGGDIATADPGIETGDRGVMRGRVEC